MTDTQKGQENAEEGKPPVEMPATEKPVEVSAPPVAEDGPIEATGELPEVAKERTRLEFEKLKEHNRQLAEKVKSYESQQPQRRSALDMFAPQEQQVTVPQPVPFYPPFVQQTQVQRQDEAIKPIVPDENGYIDVNVLNQTIEKINERSNKTEVEVRKAREDARRAEDRVSKYEHTDKTLKTYEKHPYLDPTRTDFDEKFSDLVRKELLDQMVNQGREDYLGAADKVKKEYYDPTIKAPVETKPNEVVVKRDQINAVSGVKRVETNYTDESLVSGTRSGDQDAIGKRLQKSGY